MGLAGPASWRRDPSSSVSPSYPPHPRFDSPCSPARRMGRACRFGCRNDRSVGNGEHAEEHSSDGLPIVFGENGGYNTPGAPRGRLLGSPWESGVEAGKARACWEMHEPDAVTAASARCRPGSDSRVPVPGESEPTSARESEKCVPEKNTHRPGVCGRGSLAPAGRG